MRHHLMNQIMMAIMSMSTIIRFSRIFCPIKITQKIIGIQQFLKYLYRLYGTRLISMNDEFGSKSKIRNEFSISFNFLFR